jgi:hypothetical protein
MRNSTRSLLALAVATGLAGNAFAQNDDCSGAISVVQGLNGPFTNVGSTTSAPAWPCAGGGNDVWFSYVAPGAGSLTVDTCTGTNYDSAIEVFDGTGGCGALTSLACNDDSCGLQSSATVTVVQGATYFIRVGGWSSSTGNFSLNVNGPLGAGTLATNTTLGTGCIRRYGSYYENFATSAAFDLSNTGISMLLTGTSYLALPALTTYVPPSPSAQTLTLADDSETTVTLPGTFPYAGGSTSTLTVCSNGYVSVATGNGTGWTPNVATFLNAPQTGWWNWHDYTPGLAGGGVVKYETVGSIGYITWDGVWDFSGTSAANANTFQFQFDTATGQVHLLFQTMSALGNGRLVGFSGGGASADPGSIDISAVLAATIAYEGNDVSPLTLSGLSRPVTGTSWNLNVSSIPAAATLGIEVFGLSDPNIADLGFLGAPGCPSRASLDVLNVWVTAAQPTHAYSLAIPANPALINFHVFTQGVVLVPGVNTLLGGVITSNGIDGGIGDI